MEESGFPRKRPAASLLPKTDVLGSLASTDALGRVSSDLLQVPIVDPPAAAASALANLMSTTDRSSLGPSAGPIPAVPLPHVASPSALTPDSMQSRHGKSTEVGSDTRSAASSPTDHEPDWAAVHIRDLEIQIFDKRSTLYEDDCPHIRLLPQVPVLPGGFSLDDTSHDLSEGRCQTCENKWLDPQDEEDELGTLLKQQFVERRKSGNFNSHAENWICLFCGGIFCGRYENKHYFDHLIKNPGMHCLAISINELAVWCYGCNKYIDTHVQELQPFITFYEALKFQRKAPAFPDLGSGDVPCTHAAHVPSQPPSSLRVFHNQSQCCECAQLTGPGQSKRARHALVLDDDDTGDGAKKSAGQQHEDYLCLTCFRIYCGRYEAGHMYKHRQKGEFKDHQLALDLHSLNIWCYACSSYINIQEDFATRHPNLHSLLEHFTKQKHQLP